MTAGGTSQCTSNRVRLTHSGESGALFRNGVAALECTEPVVEWTVLPGRVQGGKRSTRPIEIAFHSSGGRV